MYSKGNTAAQHEKCLVGILRCMLTDYEQPKNSPACMNGSGLRLTCIEAA